MDDAVVGVFDVVGSAVGGVVVVVAGVGVDGVVVGGVVVASEDVFVVDVSSDVVTIVALFSVDVIFLGLGGGGVDAFSVAVVGDITKAEIFFT